jgi:hypothetical protein
MPQASRSDRPARMIGMPGIVAPITPPVESSSRARYQIVGAVRPEVGIVGQDRAARRRPRRRGGEDVRRPRAPEAEPVGVQRMARRRLVRGEPRQGRSKSEAKSTSTAAPFPGASGIRSVSRSGSPSASEVRARSTSSSWWPVSCSAMTSVTATESAGRQGAISGSNSRSSGAPRPSASCRRRCGSTR